MLLISVNSPLPEHSYRTVLCKKTAMQLQDFDLSTPYIHLSGTSFLFALR